MSLRLTLIFRGVSVAEVGSGLPMEGNPSQKLPKLSPVLVVNVFIASVGARVEEKQVLARGKDDYHSYLLYSGAHHTV